MSASLPNRLSIQFREPNTAYRSSQLKDSQLCVYDPSGNLKNILPNTLT